MDTEEKKRIQLTPEQLDHKKIMLHEEETKAKQIERQIITAEDLINNNVYKIKAELALEKYKQIPLAIRELELEIDRLKQVPMRIKELEVKILELQAESKMTIEKENDFKDEKDHKDALNKVKSMKEQLLTTNSNIKVLRRQINTRLA